MRFDVDNLPSNRLFCSISFAICPQQSSIATAIERLKSIIKTLQRAQFGRRSERLDPDQLALALEDIDGDLAREDESVRATRSKPANGHSIANLPAYLSREEARLDVESMICGCCCGALHAIGESVSEMLDWILAQLRVIRITRSNMPVGLARP